MADVGRRWTDPARGRRGRRRPMETSHHYLNSFFGAMEIDGSADDDACVDDGQDFGVARRPYKLLSELSEAEFEVVAELYAMPKELGRCIWSGPEIVKGAGVPVFVKTSTSTRSRMVDFDWWPGTPGLSMVDFDLVASDTVADVKDTIQFWLGIPQNQQRWKVICVCGEIFTDMEIADDRCVVEVFSEYNFGLSRRLPLYIYVTFR